MSDTPIIKFAPRDNPDHPRLPVTAGRGYREKACEHRYSTVCSKARTVVCSDCGIQLDPIEVLCKLAHYGMGLDSRIAEIRAHREQQAEAHKEVEQRKKDRVPDALKRTNVGDIVAVEYAGPRTPRGYVRGKVVKVAENEIWVDSYSDSAGIPVEQIVSIRIIRKAQP